MIKRTQDKAFERSLAAWARNTAQSSLADYRPLEHFLGDTEDQAFAVELKALEQLATSARDAGV